MINFNIDNCSFSDAEILAILAERLHVKKDWYLDNDTICKDDYRGNPYPVDNADREAFDLYHAVKSKLYNKKQR